MFFCILCTFPEPVDIYACVNNRLTFLEVLFPRAYPFSLYQFIEVNISFLQVELEKLRLLCERISKREKVKVCLT
jgi:hypothetical protein